MLAVREKIVISKLGARALVLAIDSWIDDNFVLDAESFAGRVSVEQVLSINHLWRLKSRLLLACHTCNRRKKLEFSFAFSLEEILAIRVCICYEGSDGLLLQLLGQVQQKSLNYDHIIEF
ncbi:hypothetical protein AHMF7605_10370 [Adhaeribacter arboris]|uniref:Uncharacterized protein n=1 Tax=Adhaeribacter arboris TaxID=2072846 RepID=A0A2T2YEG1_9BACT|nr:hypothetical protein [Adhaeribacter arboris]PSR53892.1 hypothetical protein AHMF7605_10370 [Adhaeribacter arboris]